MTDQDDDIIEIMARAMDNRNDLDVTFSMLCEAALDAIRAAGMEVVPREPTQEMLIQGQYAKRQYPNVPSGTAAESVWRAMLATHTAREGLSDTAPDWPERDTRPKRGLWAPGYYSNKCHSCQRMFIGDKLAAECAPCAYGDTAPDGEGS